MKNPATIGARAAAGRVRRAVLASTGKDWEGVGVIPDVPVDPAQALVTAHLAALKALPKTPARDRAIAELERAK